MGKLKEESKMDMSAFFYEHPIFTLEEFLEWRSNQGTKNKQSAYKAIQYYVTSDKLKRLRKGLYAVVPPNTTADHYTIDPYLLAGKIASDAVLAYHTALELHGIAYSVFEQFTFITTFKISPFEYDQQLFRPVVIKKPITIGIETVNRQGINIKITTISRTFVDVLDHIELSGGFEEVCRSIENIAILNIDEIIAYCLKKNNARLAAKVGYFLEQRQGAFKVPEIQLKKLLTLKPKSPQYLSKNLHNDCRLIKKWNLMMPSFILNKKWEEPNVDI